ncbi:hypothetical protein J5X84_35165 [Streptosporangiaceae bacterium NEAU-GS5]|nr:hypothetical protein [Streptosporangiaceae bacterium NEAU-GS5]
MRHPRWLRHSAELAAKLGCPLVSLHSKWSLAGPAVRHVPPGTRLIAIDVEPPRLNLPDFAADALLSDSPFWRGTDLATKRNAGLVLAKLMGWRRIVFLDDDIEVGSADELAKAAALLDRFEAVGMRIGGYPDNSVVCHAHRLTGGNQDSFVGGGAIAVEVTKNPPFFPNIYNEDWFHLLGRTSLRRLAVTGSVRQRPYDPFDRPIRARDQELGDVLAEGVYWLLDGRPSVDWLRAADAGHWDEFLGKRRAFIENVRRRVSALPAGPVRSAMDGSLGAALGRHAVITPEFCVAYLDAWAKDRRTWLRYFSRIPRADCACTAVKWLSKDPAKPLNGKFSAPDSLTAARECVTCATSAYPSGQR